jgi:phage baseplate assembly protein W
MSGPVLTSRDSEFRPLICWPLLPLPDANGRITFPDLESSVRQRIEAVLRTAPGEQLMRPDFGAGLEQLVHQPNSAEVRSSTQETVAAAIRIYEPRILLDRVTVTPSDDARELLITIAYRIRATGVAGQVAAKVPVGAG